MHTADRLPHSLKPYILDGLLGWCAANHLTPVLIVGPDENRIVPEHMNEVTEDLGFNISPKAVLEKAITTEGVGFVTYFKKRSEPERVFFPISCWKALRVKETQQQFDLSFPETIEHQFLRWPQGVSLAPPAVVTQFDNQNTPQNTQTSGRKKAQLSLVWDQASVERGVSIQAKK